MTSCPRSSTKSATLMRIMYAKNLFPLKWFQLSQQLTQKSRGHFKLQMRLKFTHTALGRFKLERTLWGVWGLWFRGLGV